LLVFRIGLRSLGLVIARLAPPILARMAIDSRLSAQDLTNMTERTDFLRCVQVGPAPGRGTQLHGSLSAVAIVVRLESWCEPV
jgi:hypothetical protein